MRFDNFSCGYLAGMAFAVLMDGSFLLAMWLGALCVAFSLLPDD